MFLKQLFLIILHNQTEKGLIMKFMRLFLFMLLCVFFNHGLYALFSSKNLTTNAAFAFLSDQESKKATLDSLQNLQTTLKKNSDEATKNIVKRSHKINLDITEAQGNLKGVRESEFEYINKKISVLNARKQILQNQHHLS